MKTPHRFIRVVLLGTLVALLMASAAMAKGGGIGMFLASDAGKAAVHEPGTCDSQDEGTAQDEGTSEEQESDDQGTPEDQESDDQGTSEDQESDESCEQSDEGTADQSGDQGDREKACREAAGMTEEPGGGTEGEETSETEATGLDHAIEVVMANCIKNPQAPGLLNALRHLVANRDNHMAHDEELAARRAAHDAAKAEHQASKGEGHGHSSDE
jgi:hypothetical protein